MVVVRRADGAAFFEQMRCREPALRTRGFQRLGLEAVAVGLVEQRAEHRGEFGRQLVRDQLADHALDGLRLQALLLEPGERRSENFGRRLAVTSAPLAVKIDRR